MIANDNWLFDQEILWTLRHRVFCERVRELHFLPDGSGRVSVVINTKLNGVVVIVELSVELPKEGVAKTNTCVAFNLVRKVLFRKHEHALILPKQREVSSLVLKEIHHKCRGWDVKGKHFI